MKWKYEKSGQMWHRACHGQVGRGPPSIPGSLMVSAHVQSLLLGKYPLLQKVPSHSQTCLSGPQSHNCCFCEEALRTVKINAKHSSITLWECKLVSTGLWTFTSLKSYWENALYYDNKKKPYTTRALKMLLLLDTDLFLLRFFWSVLQLQNLSFPCALLLTTASGVCHFQQVICEASAPLSASFIW